MPMMALREDEEAVRELYDLENDPEEVNNVIGEYPEVARELADLANDYIERQAPLTEGTIQEYDPSAAKGVRVTFNALMTRRRPRGSALPSMPFRASSEGMRWRSDRDPARLLTKRVGQGILKVRRGGGIGRHASLRG